ncbi:hypothetical protein BV20DRAFT_1035224 [Pilatotrama ljubarskyi]|nr:hypothetical protein BV20DRAFT_1035224 [Pilatotrama ljubarskyi]
MAGRKLRMGWRSQMRICVRCLSSREYPDCCDRTRIDTSRSNRFRKYDDKHTWKQRIQHLDAHWNEVMPRLIDAYPVWRYPSPGDSSKNTTSPSHCDDTLSLAESLVLNGYLSTTPIRPSMAVSLKTLELFRRIRLFKASFSMEAFAKLIPYRRTIRNVISDTFDIYLAILRAVKKQVDGALGRDTPDWRLADEPPQTFSRMYCMDGNNSLKRMRTLGGRKTGDSRIFEDSDYFLPKEYVERFAHEKAAQSDEKKRSWDIFDETGIFASACRHGFILWIIDMVHSGELAKYPLATISKALDVVGERTVCGYDVGCALVKTVNKSSLAARFAALNSRLCVNAFHGYSHEYSCQVRHHPICIEGMGLEDLETLERIFSASNQLAAVTRYTSPYRRRVLIDAFFQQWDDEKYLNLGKMLYNNYRQALTIIRKQGIVVAKALQSLGLTPEALARFADEERAYLSSLGTKSPQDLHEIAYVEALQELRSVSYVARSFNLDFLPARTSPITDYEGELSTGHKAETARRKIETARRYLDDRRKALTLEVADLEVHLGIAARWQPSDAEYMHVAQYIVTRKYQQALANVQRLVVQRLFELHKMNLSQTGYWMRRHIAKNMQTRSWALRNAIQVYNTAASALDPPRPKLDWETEFDLLNDTRADIREKPWAHSAVRETVWRARRLARAHEEITAVNIEAHRVHTAIRDEEALFVDVLTQLATTGDVVHGAVLEYVTRRCAANAHLYKLPGFSGNPTPGRRAGTDAAAAPGHTQGRDPQDVAEPRSLALDDIDADDADLEDEEVQDELTALADFTGQLGA